MNPLSRLAIVIASVYALLSVAIGAFAAHGLKSVVSEYALSIIETGARYQMYHALALLFTGLFIAFVGNKTQGRAHSKALTLVVFGFVGGTFLFSFSLYALALTEIRWLGMITPLGGLLLLIAWGSLIYTALCFKRELHV